MSVPATERWFSLSIRRNRKSYIFASLILIAIMAVVFSALWFFEARNDAGTIIFLVFFLMFGVCQYFLAAQRLRDMNLTGWLALLWIPIGMADEFVGGALSLAALVVLASVPGTDGPNRYGPDPLQPEF
jgi:uncharacterized membrane protein YhaH (DUF805 family)